MNRGIIASPAVYVPMVGGFQVERSISAEELRYFVLYWDQVVIPDSQLISFRIPDQDVLIETGIVSRPLAKMEPGVVYKDSWVVASEAQIAKDLIENDTSTDWVLHQIGSDLSIPSTYRTDMRTVRVQLQRTLPMPGENVPIAEILDFKERRRDELGNLHQLLDEAYLEILNSPDPSLASKAAISRLKKSISDLDTVSRERWKKTRKADFSIELNIDGGKVMTGAAAAAAFNFYTGSTATIALAAAGGIFSCVKVSAKKTVTFEPAKANLKLSYLTHGQEERILPRPVQSNQSTATRSFLSPTGLTEARRMLAKYMKLKK